VVARTGPGAFATAALVPGRGVDGETGRTVAENGQAGSGYRQLVFYTP